MKYFRIFLVAFLLLFPIFSFAQVVINEIMYDSPGADDDWVEIYNSGSVPVTITTGSGNGSWRFVDTSPHTLTPFIDGNNVLAPGSYAIITNDTAKFSSDWPAFTGVVFKSSFSLTNTSNTIFLKDGLEAVTDPAVSYTSTQGAKGDGNSLQRQTDGTWIPATPTPGSANSNTALTTTVVTDQPADDSSQDDNQTVVSSSSSNTSAHSSPSSLSGTENKIEFEISAGRDRLTTVGNNLIFRVTATKLQNMPESGITYRWSFGDGSVAQGNNINHAYKFAGEYSVVVNADYSDKQAVSRMQVRVVSPDITITKVPGGVEIFNNSKVEINLEGWSLVSSRKTFIFPTDTLIPSGKKIIFADDVTGMLSDTIQLLNPLGKEFGYIKRVDAEVLGATISNKTDVNLNDIQAKIEEVKNTIAQISKEPQSPKTSDKINITLAKTPISTPTPNIGVNAKENSDKTANTATVFEATNQKGFISTMFSWPIKGFNFVRHLFVEE